MYGTALSLTEVNITMPRLMANVSAPMQATASSCPMISSRLCAGLYGGSVVGMVLPFLVVFVMFEKFLEVKVELTCAFPMVAVSLCFWELR